MTQLSQLTRAEVMIEFKVLMRTTSGILHCKSKGRSIDHRSSAITSTKRGNLAS